MKKVPIDMREQLQRDFNDFSAQTSMHGWVFLGGLAKNVSQKGFWAIIVSVCIGFTVLYLMDAVRDFNSVSTKINTEDRSANLEDVFLRLCLAG